MRIRQVIANVWRSLVQRKRAEEELTDEVGSFLELLTAEKVAAGKNPHDARREALLELGGTEQVKENVRDVRPGAVFEQIGKDAVYALRTL